MNHILKRKIDSFLLQWKQNPQRLPLIIKGSRQIGKTFSIEHFAKNYSNFIEINFVTEPQYKTIFDTGFKTDDILKQISFVNPDARFVANDTLILFDEMQACPNCATSLKFFKLDGRFDVICSGSLMGINYQEIESNSVGYKEEYEMQSLDFEEFLWAKGYSETQIEDLYTHIAEQKPFSQLEMDVMFRHFLDYILVGGMPAIVRDFVSQNNFSGILKKQQMLLLDYEEDITKYAVSLDKRKIKNIYRSIPNFLAMENKKFQISKVAKGARSREYVGTVDWLADAGIINVCHNLNLPELPMKGNANANEYKIYFRDTGLLIASLDDESQTDLRHNRNFNTYKGALYENIVADMLVKAGYSLYYFRNEKSTVEMDFFIRDAESLIPVEVKAKDNATPSLNKLITDTKYKDIRYGIKLCYKNIGFNGEFYTLPYFATFLLKRWINERIVKL
jgi:hypothetical protein